MLGERVVAMDAFEILLPRQHEIVVRQAMVDFQRAIQHLAHYVFHETRVAMRLVDDEELIGPLEQLVNLGTHRPLNDMHQIERLDLFLCADQQRAAAALIVGCQRDQVEDTARGCGVHSLLFLQQLAGIAADHILRTWASCQPVRLDAYQPPLPRFPGYCHADQRVNRLGRLAGNGRGLAHREFGAHLYFRGHRFLTLYHLIGQLCGEGLDVGRPQRYHLVDDLLKLVAEARHVNAGLFRRQIDEQIDGRVE